MKRVSLFPASLALLSSAVLMSGCTESEKVEVAKHDAYTRLTLEEKVAQLQDRAPAVERLNIQGYSWWNEGLHGVARAGEATVFPQAIGLAATWNTSLLNEIGKTVGLEARAKFNGFAKGETIPRYYGLTIWSPNVNIFRDPRWGRGQETYGEDPYLTGSLASHFISGMQGPDDNHYMAVASVKHIAAHSGPEGIRHGFDSKATPYDMEATFLPAFRQTVKEGKTASVMCAYNAIDGVPVCADPVLITARLRDEWGFEGYVVTDCGAVYDMQEFHHYRPTMAKNAIEVLTAGVDVNCGNGFSQLPIAVKDGDVEESAIDLALSRVWSIREKLGLDGRGSPYDSISPDAVHTSEFATLAAQAARESMVLLKNDGILPLSKDNTIAVIGPNADLLESLRGNYHGIIVDPITPLKGLRDATSSDSVLYAQGSNLAEGVGITIPETALTTAFGDVGLTGEYFASPDFTGEPVLVRTERTVNLDLQNTVPADSLTKGQYSARWSGFIQPPENGVYTLSVQVENCWSCSSEQHDGVRLFVDDQAVIVHNMALEDDADTTDNGKLHGVAGKTASLSASVNLKAGHKHAIRMEFTHRGDWGIRLQWQAPADAQIAEAIDVLKKADVGVVFVGLSPDLEGEELSIEVPGFDRGDRTSLTLPARQQQLLSALKTTGKPLVVVVMSGSAVSTNWSDENASAVLQAWYPGESGGQAIAQTLFGDYNPAGRMPVTVYRSEQDLPPFEDYDMQGRTYRYFKGNPLYPFGHGLSYSEFAYSDLSLSQSALKAGESLTVTGSVTNTSDVTGDEVVQIYLSSEGASQGLLRELVAFSRVNLKPGETKKVTFTLSPRMLSTVSANGTRAVVEGNYRLYVGGSQPTSDSEPLSFNITGHKAMAL